MVLHFNLEFALARLFIAEGVQAQRIMATGFGESAPIALGDTDAARAENRRLELSILPIVELAPATAAR